MKRKSQPAPAPIENLDEVLARLGIQAWDILLVGDGSGSGWGREAGWATVSIERATGERLVWCGGMNRGTVNVAEVMAYLQPLNWFATREELRRGAGGRTKAFQVHIITDSQYCRDNGASNNRLRVKNSALWAAFDVFLRQGFVLNWHWLPRDELALNSYCDQLSRVSRVLFKKYNDPQAAAASAGLPPVTDVNPGSGRDAS